MEFADLIAQYAGCLIGMIGTKAGHYPVIGNLENPAFVEKAEGSTGATNGDFNGFDYTIYAETGITTPVYDVDTPGIDLTPNP